jgi:hypothetical protein
VEGAITSLDWRILYDRNIIDPKESRNGFWIFVGTAKLESGAQS